MKKSWILLRFLLINILIISFLSEIGTIILYPYVFNKKFSRKTIRQKLISDDKNSGYITINANPDEQLFIFHSKVLHPYLGFVYSTDVELQERINFYGFIGKKFVKRSEDEIHIAITGGSVAMLLCQLSANTIIDRLKNSVRFEKKKIHIHNLAIGGYKQPQQLMALNYFLSLGSEFDIWINLDGFNEIVLACDNLLSKVAPIFPRKWNIYAQKAVSHEAVDKMVEIKSIRDIRSRKKEKFSGTVLSNSAFFLAMWEATDMKNRHQEYMLHKQLEDIVSKQVSFQTSGPLPDYKAWHEALPDVADIWTRSSVQMARLCEANGIKYYHFIQPNQYYKGSKVFNDEEKVIAFEEEGSYHYKVFAQAGYPLFVEEGKKLKESGIPFYDLTMIFKDEKRTVYSDKCCHFNKLGYDTMANKISDVIISDF